MTKFVSQRLWIHCDARTAAHCCSCALAWTLELPAYLPQVAPLASLILLAWPFVYFNNPLVVNDFVGTHALSPVPLVGLNTLTLSGVTIGRKMYMPDAMPMNSIRSQYVRVLFS